jgi:hypothetical protein
MLYLIVMAAISLNFDRLLENTLIVIFLTIYSQRDWGEEEILPPPFEGIRGGGGLTVYYSDNFIFNIF